MSFGSTLFICGRASGSTHIVPCVPRQRNRVTFLRRSRTAFACYGQHHECAFRSAFAVVRRFSARFRKELSVQGTKNISSTSGTNINNSRVMHPFC